MGIVKWTFIISSVVLAYVSYNLINKPEIKSKIIQLDGLGSVQGFVSRSREGRKFSEYLGVPYAKPPIGALRFEPPQNVEPWVGLKLTNKYGSECVQLSMMTASPVGAEDCLFLNVFVPKLESKKLLPVMFFIHGGAFYEGSSNFYRPHYFMDHDVVLVTINYRLSALGFLNTNDGLINGNMGLKDQNMALKFVNKYIQSFGGDPNKVTIFGESAGGASVHYHMMSPMSKGLFQRAISQSGTAFQPRAYFGGDVAEQAKRLANQLNCSTKSAAQMCSCLKSIHPHQFVFAHQAEALDPLRDRMSIYLPTKEIGSGKDVFLEDHPLNIITSRNSAMVPWMTGMNSQEGLLVEALLARNDTLRQVLRKDWISKMPYFLHMDPKYIDFMEKIKQYYFKTSNGKTNHLEFDAASQNYTNLLSDRCFLYGFHEAVKLHVQKSLSPTFAYYFKYEGQFSLYTILTAIKGNYHPIVEVLGHFVKTWFNKVLFGIEPVKKGVCHADELQFLFRLERMNDISKGQPDYEISTEIVRLWVSFAKNDKTLSFKQVQLKALEKSSRYLQYLSIDTVPAIIDEPFEERMLFWDQFKQYYWGSKT